MGDNKYIVNKEIEKKAFVKLMSLVEEKIRLSVKKLGQNRKDYIPNTLGVPDTTYKNHRDKAKKGQHPGNIINRLDVYTQYVFSHLTWKQFCIAYWNAKGDLREIVNASDEVKHSKQRTTADTEDLKLNRSSSMRYLKTLRSDGGRFESLTILENLLPRITDSDLIASSVEFNGSATQLSQLVDSINTLSHSNLMVIGDGGMGKTVSMVNLWEGILRRETNDVPFYVPLNQIPENDPEEKKEFPITRFLCKNYLRMINVGSSDIKLARSYFAKQVSNSGKFILLLDGINEIPKESKTLDFVIDEIHDLATSYHQIHIVLTSRYEIGSNISPFF